MQTDKSQPISLPINGSEIEGTLVLPINAHGIVLFAHGSGSSRHSVRNNFVAKILNDEGMGTLLLDLLTQEEDQDFRARFDMALLTQRLLAATRWVKTQAATQHLPVGYFGASTGAAAALQAAAALGGGVKAVVSRGGRPDLAGQRELTRVKAPTLLLVGGRDESVIEMNQMAYALLPCHKKMVIVPGATHLFEEPGALEEVAQLAAQWFAQHLKP
jgi:putative phosphoribosyl transferase